MDANNVLSIEMNGNDTIFRRAQRPFYQDEKGEEVIVHQDESYFNLDVPYRNIEIIIFMTALGVEKIKLQPHQITVTFDPQWKERKEMQMNLKGVLRGF
jgi:hypothetical protein